MRAENRCFGVSEERCFRRADAAAGRAKRPRLAHFPPEGEVHLLGHSPRLGPAHAGGQVGRPRPSDPTGPSCRLSVVSEETLRPVGPSGLAWPTFPLRARCICLVFHSALAPPMRAENRCFGVSEERCFRRADAAAGRAKRPRLAHFPLEGEVHLPGSSQRLGTAHAGGQVDRPRPSDPTGPSCRLSVVGCQ